MINIDNLSPVLYVVMIYFVFHFCKASRINEFPMAIAKPSTQEVNQPNDLVIDGSG